MKSMHLLFSVAMLRIPVMPMVYKELQFFIKSQPKQMEFDETLAKHLLSKITVFDDHIIFEFKSGVTVSVEK